MSLFKDWIRINTNLRFQWIISIYFYLFFYPRANCAFWRCGAQTGSSDDVPSSLWFWLRFPSSVLAVLRRLWTRKSSIGSRSGKTHPGLLLITLNVIIMNVTNKKVQYFWQLLRQLFYSPAELQWSSLCPSPSSGKMWAWLPLHCWSDGSFSPASVRPDVLLSVPQPAALFAGLGGLGEPRSVCGPRPISNAGLVSYSHAGLWWAAATPEFVTVESRSSLSHVSFIFSSILAAVSVAVGDCVGSEWGGSAMGLCQGAVPVGAHHTPSLAKICLFLEAPQASRPAPQQGEYRENEDQWFNALLFKNVSKSWNYFKKWCLVVLYSNFRDKDQFVSSVREHLTQLLSYCFDVSKPAISRLVLF